jgi:hypothetical protein
MTKTFNNGMISLASTSTVNLMVGSTTTHFMRKGESAHLSLIDNLVSQPSLDISPV